MSTHPPKPRRSWSSAEPARPAARCRPPTHTRRAGPDRLPRRRPRPSIGMHRKRGRPRSRASAPSTSRSPPTSQSTAPPTSARFAAPGRHRRRRTAGAPVRPGRGRHPRAERRCATPARPGPILRSSWFDQNFTESYLLDPVLAGLVALPVGEMVEPFVDADDIADVAVAALAEPGHVGEVYELTGPRLLTFGEVVAEIAHTSGRRIDYVPISIDEYVASDGRAAGARRVRAAPRILVRRSARRSRRAPRRRCPARPRSGTTRLHRVRTRRGRRRRLGVGRPEVVR